MLELVTDAPDFATLRQRLIAKYGEMSHERETELLHQGMLVAELAGRYSVRREAGLARNPDAVILRRGGQDTCRCPQGDEDRLFR